MRSQSFLNLPQTPLGSYRDWVWRGWQIRYTYIRPTQVHPELPSLPVICLHGFGSALGQWRSNLLPLGERHCVYALDFLGFGASEKAAAHYNVWLWADLVYDFWQSLIGQPAVVVGHSLGALVALTAVARHPEMAAGLSLLTLPDAQLKQPPAWARAVERFFASPALLWPLFQLVQQPWLLRWVLRKIYLRPELVDEELVSLFATPPRDRGALEVFYRLSLSSRDQDYSPNVRDLLPGVEVPILLLWGEEDRIVPFASARALKALNSNLQLVEIACAGHCVYDEEAERVNQELLDWIEKTVQFAQKDAWVNE